jgi:uncharacterized protein (TIGR02453 family)
MGFTGFPADAFAFYDGLEADNSREYWQANKARYETAVKGPMQALCNEVDERYRPMHIFRPNRDVRFSSDKSPYKTHTGAMSELAGGSLVYVQLSATGLMAAAGYYMMANDQLARYRDAVDDEAAGAELIAVADALAKAKRPVRAGGGGELKTAPKGYNRDHPRIEWLRRKGLIISAEFGTPKWVHTRAALAKVQGLWEQAAPLNEWLDRHVGPSTLPPEDRW